MNVKDNLINVMRINNIDYISLTDLARYKNPDNPGDVVIKWMSNKNSFDFYSLWEELFNEDFKLAESREFKNDSANNSFTMSPSRWISLTNAKGFISKRGKYDGGTFAHPDIALEFASWLDPAFKLYLIQEFERLKYNETYQQKIEWSVRRSLSKTNYRIHTDSIKENIVPTLTDKQKLFYLQEIVRLGKQRYLQLYNKNKFEKYQHLIRISKTKSLCQKRDGVKIQLRLCDN